MMMMTMMVMIMLLGIVDDNQVVLRMRIMTKLLSKVGEAGHEENCQEIDDLEDSDDDGDNVDEKKKEREDTEEDTNPGFLRRARRTLRKKIGTNLTNAEANILISLFENLPFPGQHVMSLCSDNSFIRRLGRRWRRRCRRSQRATTLPLPSPPASCWSSRRTRRRRRAPR